MPTTKRARILILFVLLLFVAACGGDAETPTPAPAETAVSEAAQATNTPPPTTAVAIDATPTTAVTPTTVPPPTPTSVPVVLFNVETGEVTDAPEPLPPLSLSELVLVDGEIDGEKLMAALQLIIGEAAPAELGLTTPIGEGGTTLLGLADEYVQSEGGDPALQSEISRLLDIVAPTPAQVARYAQPAEESRNGRVAGVAAMQTQGVACEQAWLAGLPNEGAVNCFLYNRVEVDNTYEVYYPADWADDEDDSEQEALYDIAMAAMLDSAAVFGQWGAMNDVTVIFSMLPYADNDGTGFMSVPWRQMGPGEPCPVLIYTNSQLVDRNAFRQSVAHELFHCFQAWNYPDAVGRLSANRWWVEGTAEYFSNVVYPEINHEHRVLRHFDANSTIRSILDMAYENAVFFQHVANEMGGPTAVLDLLDSLPLGGGKSAQQQALASYGDMAGMFQSLGTLHLSSTGIADPGGGALVLDQVGVRPGAIAFSGEQSEELESEPFVLGRQLLSYEEEKRFDQTVTMDENGLYTAVLASDRRNLGAWSELPEVVLGQCEDPTRYLALVTTVESDSVALEVVVDEMQQADCDPCLLGAWEIDRDTFAGYLSNAFNENTEGSGIEFVISDVSGQLFLTFDEERKMSIGSQDFSTTITVSPLGQTIAVVIEASGSAMYNADGEMLSASNFDTTVTGSNETGTSAIDITGNTAVLSLPLNNLFGYGAQLGAGVPQNINPQPLAYTCTEETLSYDIDPFGTIIWNRMEEIPPTPVPTPTD